MTVMPERKFLGRLREGKLLVHYSLFPVIAQCGYDCSDVVNDLEAESPGSTRWYPDGTLAITQDKACSRFWEKYHSCVSDLSYQDRENSRTALGCSILARGTIYSHPAFECMYYETRMWHEAFRKHEVGVVVHTCNEAMINRPAIPAAPLESLPFVLELDKRIVANYRKRTVELFVNWFHRQAATPMPGEGGIRLAKPTARFRDKSVELLLDASQSGQHSLNWLSLETIFHGKQFLKLIGIIMYEGGWHKYVPAPDEDEPDKLDLVPCSIEELFGPVRDEIPLPI